MSVCVGGLEVERYSKGQALSNSYWFLFISCLQPPANYWFPGGWHVSVKALRRLVLHSGLLLESQVRVCCCHLLEGEWEAKCSCWACTRHLHTAQINTSLVDLITFANAAPMEMVGSYHLAVSGQKYLRTLWNLQWPCWMWHLWSFRAIGIVEAFPAPFVLSEVLLS